jgi:putative endonuclease
VLSRGFFVITMHYTYIIQSLKDQSFYKGYSANPLSRLHQHNNFESKYTSAKVPWKLVHIEIFDTKREALIREKVLKKYSHFQLEALITSNKNKLYEYLGTHHSLGFDR